jgi:hypothetical protein
VTIEAVPAQVDDLESFAAHGLHGISEDRLHMISMGMLDPSPPNGPLDRLRKLETAATGIVVALSDRLLKSEGVLVRICKLWPRGEERLASSTVPNTLPTPVKTVAIGGRRTRNRLGCNSQQNQHHSN